MDIGTLDPETKDKLLAQYLANHPDEAEPSDPMARVCQIVQLLKDRLDNVETHVKSLEDVLMNDLVGGLTDIYHQGVRSQGLNDLQSKYGDLFKPFDEPLRALGKANGVENMDYWGPLYDELDKMRQEEGYDDSKGDAFIRQKVDELAKYLEETGKVAGMLPKKEEPVAAVKVETATVPSGAEKKIKKMAESYHGYGM